MAITLVPILAHLGAWGRVWLPVSEELSIRAELLEKGGPPMWEQFMDELRHEHLGTPVATPALALPSARPCRPAMRRWSPARLCGARPRRLTNLFSHLRPALL